MVKKKFKKLTFFNIKLNGQRTKLEMFVPGINSGVYDKALHIQIRIKDQGIFKKNIFAAITLSENDVRELKNECNKILKL